MGKPVERWFQNHWNNNHGLASVWYQWKFSEGFRIYFKMLQQDFLQIEYECEKEKIWNEAKIFFLATKRMDHPFKWERKKKKPECNRFTGQKIEKFSFGHVSWRYLLTTQFIWQVGSCIYEFEVQKTCLNKYKFGCQGLIAVIKIYMLIEVIV